MNNNLSFTNDMTHIEDLQTMLRYLALAYGYEEQPTVTGVYDRQTQAAVRAAQDRYGLPMTGVVDVSTWDAISADYRRENNRRDPVMISAIPADPYYQTATGERSDTVVLLQLLLSALGQNYDYGAVPISGIYGVSTADAVRHFQEKNGLTPTGIADRETWHRIAEEFNNLIVQ